MDKISLEEIRARMKWSQEDIASILGICRATYSNKEIGKTPILAQELSCISNATGISMDSIKLPARRK